MLDFWRDKKVFETVVNNIRVDNRLFYEYYYEDNVSYLLVIVV